MQTGSKNKAKVAIAHSLARTVYHLISDPDSKYKEKGDVRVNNPVRQIKNSLEKLKRLGVTVNYNEHTKIVDAKLEITQKI
jgi:hypothetical protein